MEVTFQNLSYSFMQFTTPALEKRAVCGVLHKGVFKNIALFRSAPTEVQQIGANKMLECDL
ncbi:MAG: hypothetical protein JO166_08630 [Deltaproteobacteria bacterium]|nr:hypothetical protein [Deltaproteobacteria bacterium]